MNRPLDPLKAWLAEMLLLRGHYKGPTGQPLYQYQLAAADYAALSSLLKTHRLLHAHPLFGRAWAGAFCLYVAERFRREYDGDATRWSWEWGPLGQAVDVDFGSQALRAHVVEEGLEYWRRPVRKRESGRNFLGSLFLEGGLPWPLVQNERHGFGQLVRWGLKHHYRTEGGRTSTANLIGEQLSRLPQTFRTVETRDLLAGVVDQLMYLVRQHPLKGVPDPAAHLDTVEKRWRDAFPIPLDEVNGRTLVNDWLRDADKSNREKAEAIAREQDFSCVHCLLEGPVGERLQAEFTIPVEIRLPSAGVQLTTTRLVPALFEGERLIRQGRPCYAKLEDGGFVVPFSESRFTFERRSPEEPVVLRLLASGQVVYSHVFDDSALDRLTGPLVFVRRNEQWQLEAVASCRLPADRALLRLPAKGILTTGEPTDLRVDGLGGRWMEIAQDTHFEIEDERYAIRLRATGEGAAGLDLSGTLAHWESMPRTVYLGRPTLIIREGSCFSRKELQEYENGIRSEAGPKPRAGVIRHAVKDADGQTLLLRRFGLLPAGFRVLSRPAGPAQPARVVLSKAAGLQWKLTTAGVSAMPLVYGEDLELQLNHAGSDYPTHVDLELHDAGAIQPVTLRIAYPAEGVRLIDSQGRASKTREWLLDDLLGSRLILSSSREGGADFDIEFQLQHGVGVRIQRYYRIRAARDAVSVSLYGYLPDIRQMLSAVQDQHAAVRMTVFAMGSELLRLTMGRYNGQLVQDLPGRYAVRDRANSPPLEGAVVEAMSVADPARARVPLPERTSEGTGTGVFDLPAVLERDGPWILYSAKESRIRFAPALHLGNSDTASEDTEIDTLHEAARAFDPKHNPAAFDDVIAKMADNWHHGSWHYLEDLRHNFSHLPMATFQVWLALTRNSKALATTILRLDLDVPACERMRDELAIVWEAVPIQDWVQAFKAYKEWREAGGLPEVAVAALLENRRHVVTSIVPGLEPLAEYLFTGDSKCLPRLPPLELLVTPDFENLRRNHSSDPNWPTDLGNELAEWVRTRQSVPQGLRELADVKFAEAVTYLPMFMAHVTAGVATLADLPGKHAYVRFVVRKLSDYDQRGWYLPVFTVMLGHLLKRAQ